MSWAVLEEPQHPEVPLPWLPPLTCLCSPVPVAGAEAAAGAQPGSLLQRFPAQRQPDWQRRGRVPGEQLPLRWLPRAGGELLPSVPWGGGSGAGPGPDEEPRRRLLLGTDGVKEVFSSNPFACPHLCPRGGLIRRWCGGLTSPCYLPPTLQGPLHSPLDSTRSTRHHGLVERVQRDPRRMMSPLRRYVRQISFIPARSQCSQCSRALWDSPLAQLREALAFCLAP